MKKVDVETLIDFCKKEIKTFMDEKEELPANQTERKEILQARAEGVAIVLGYLQGCKER